MRNDRGARVARGSAIAAFATLTASAAHTLGGGAPPGALTLALALAFSVPLAVAVVGRRAGLLRSSIAAIAAQLALHALYSLGSARGPSVSDASSGALAASSAALPHQHHTGHVGHTTSGTTLADAAAAASPAHAVHVPAWMLLTHGVAALLTIVFIASADRVLAAVAAAARGIRLAWALAGAPLAAWPAEPARPLPTRSIGRLRSLHLLSWRHRGPPHTSPVA